MVCSAEMADPASTWAVVTTIATGGATVAVAAFAAVSWRVERKRAADRRMQELLNRYSATEYLEAVRALHRFAEDNKEQDLASLFRLVEGKEERNVDRLPPAEKGAFLCHTLTNHRRVVAHFYYTVWASVAQRTVPRRRIFSFWTTGALDIIPKVLLPIGRDPDKHLDELCRMAERFESRWRRRLLDVLWMACGVALGVIWAVVVTLLEHR
jgi:hypothetical protein